MCRYNILVVDPVSFIIIEPNNKDSGFFSSFIITREYLIFFKNNNQLDIVKGICMV